MKSELISGSEIEYYKGFKSQNITHINSDLIFGPLWQMIDVVLNNLDYVYGHIEQWLVFPFVLMLISYNVLTFRFH